jgi:hypothetical protein
MAETPARQGTDALREEPCKPAARPASDVVEAVLGAERMRELGRLQRADGNQVRPEDLKVTVTYWGGGKRRVEAAPVPGGGASGAGIRSRMG